MLDEPNANLDSDGEAALSAAVGRLRRDGAAVIVVAHRPNVLAAVDRVLVLRDGAIEMLGPTEQVLARLTRPAAAPAERRPLVTAEAGDE